MSLPHFATATARHPSGTATAIRITIHQAIPRVTRRVAVGLLVFALLDLIGWGILGRYPISSPYCWFALILGVGLWLSEGHRRLTVETERLCRELERRRAVSDLDGVVKILLDK